MKKARPAKALALSSILLSGTSLLLSSCTSMNATANQGKNQMSQYASNQKESSTVPLQRYEYGWPQLHEENKQKAKAGGVELAFFGDSITQAMDKGTLIEYFGKAAKNFGIGGDRTEHLLWRLQNGELNFPGPGPKTLVLLIGTNNLSEWPGIAASSDQEVFDGVKACLAEIQKQLPQTKILLLGILPRAARPEDPLRQRVNSVNQLLEKLDDGKRIFYADIGKSLLEKDGSLSPETMPDMLHPTQERGYPLMFAAIKNELARIKD